MGTEISTNPKARMVELRTKPDTPDASNLQKCAHLVDAFMMGFEAKDAVAHLHLLICAWMSSKYLHAFDIRDVKPFRGEYLSRAIGRLSGKGGKTRFAMENSTKTRIVIAEYKIHQL
ncbi:hypothetical protein RJ639_008570 [Escallonia herrerae]|uniref:PNO1 second type I KH domain-containing protein n=1 Tax=Escallonia herrerae TaxID=1293975 RepID=A0AA88VSH3_9ASTE|nr:hypothetical protein RJ639_008570 [Escallonia herrerae]